MVDERVEGLGCVVLVSHAADLRAGFASQAGMVGYSLRHRGDELLGQRGGLAAYRRSGSSFGIPLLHPWANRLSSHAYSVSGREALLDPQVSPVRLDPNGFPIHGLLTASRYWELESRIACAERAAIGARLDFGAHDELLAAFPFPHELRVEAELAVDTLTVATTLSATGDVGVPLSFGWHPYLRLPGVPREEWTVELAVKTRALLDERGIPTGSEEPAEVSPGPLGARGYDDLFTSLTEPPRFALEGGGRRIELEFGRGYPMAQVYAPPEERFICFEPMTAPTDALRAGSFPVAEPGKPYRAVFSIAVLF